MAGLILYAAFVFGVVLLLSALTRRAGRANRRARDQAAWVDERRRKDREAGR